MNKGTTTILFVVLGLFAVVGIVLYMNSQQKRAQAELEAKLAAQQAQFQSQLSQQDGGDSIVDIIGELGPLFGLFS